MSESTSSAKVEDEITNVDSISQVSDEDEEGDADLFDNQEDRVTYLKRGGVVVQTSIGAIQFGMPPETIKDSMALGLSIPTMFVVPPVRFNRQLGPNEGINIAEFEFPAYANFFFRQRRVNLIVSNEEVEERIRVVFQETLLGPKDIDVAADFTEDFPRDKMPDLEKELAYFRKFGDSELSVDRLLQFTHFQRGVATLTGDAPKEGGDADGSPPPVVKIHHQSGYYTVFEDNKVIARIHENIKLPLPDQIARFETSFRPPLFGVTVLGNSHGFDPAGRTSGYVVWVNRRGIMVDPPPHSTAILMQQCIPPSLIDGVIITHCHADHDAGTFQKILREGRVTLMTTPTIMYSFLRKYAALSGLDLEFLRGVFHYRAVSIGQAIKIRGGKFEFFYTLHSIPCIGFQVSFGGRSMVFSADHMNDPEKINMLYDTGVISGGRRDRLLNFPWEHDIILHEAGVPPIHTPMKTLLALPEDVKKRLYVVHSAKKTIPEGLKVAEEGVQNTLWLQVERPRYSDAIEILDVISSIDLFSKLSLTHAREVLQIARRVKYEIGTTVVTHKSWRDNFYVVAAGVVEARVTLEDGEDPNLLINGALNVRGSISGSSEVGSVVQEKKPHAFKRSMSGINVAGNVARAESAGLQSTLPASSGERPGNATWSSTENKPGSGSSDGASKGQMYRVVQRYVTGEYFGEESLLNLPPRKVEFVAKQRATIIEFEKPDFQWLLEGTKIMERMLHLVDMRKDNIVQLIRGNSVLSHLTLSQITQLEEYLFRYEVKKGTHIWKKGDPAERAFIVESGQIKFDSPIPRSRRPSEMTSSRHDSKELAAALQSALAEPSGGSTPASLSSGAEVGSGEALPAEAATSPRRSFDRKLLKKSASMRVSPMGPGSFIADTDALLGSSSNSVGVVAATDCTLLMIDRKDLIIFYSNNPGVLLATVHTFYVA